MAVRPGIYRRADLLALDVLQAPLWVFDLDQGLRWWVNLAGVELWGAPSREHLIRPGVVMEQSEATRTRMVMYRRRLEQGEMVRERWTIYPDGQASIAIESTCSGILIDDELGEAPRLAMLVEARKLSGEEVDPLEWRSVEALRHVGEPVSLYSPGGEVLLRNPAAVRVFGDPGLVARDSDALAAMFVDPADAATSRAALAGEVQRFDARMRTSAGEQVHTLEVRGTLDPVTGEQALLICSRDLSERLAYEQALEHSRALLAAQAESLAAQTETLAAQTETLVRLSAPVLRVWPRIVVLPLIGRVDRARMAVALTALAAHMAGDEARVVIFDLTGAAFVDVETAQALRGALQVLRLQGCKVLVAGVLPALATVLVAAEIRLAVPIYQTIAEALRDSMTA